MQTFLPFKNFVDSANALDNKRLNKQVLEGYQILKVLSNDDPRAGWRNHPAVKMWRGHENILWQYVMAMVDEANKRGIKTDKNVENLNTLRQSVGNRWGSSFPIWYQNAGIMRRVTTTHRANLHIKDPEYYYNFASSVVDKNNEPCCERCNYFWVTHTQKVAA